MIETKVWGTTQRITPPELVGRLEKFQLRVRAKRYCSWHRHLYRENVFHSIDAILYIPWMEHVCDEQQEAESGHILLRPGECCTIGPNFWHQFIVIESGIVIEDYVLPDYRKGNGLVLIDDIERQWSGGKLKPAYQISRRDMKNDRLDPSSFEGGLPVAADGEMVQL